MLRKIKVTDSLKTQDKFVFYIFVYLHLTKILMFIDKKTLILYIMQRILYQLQAYI